VLDISIRVAVGRRLGDELRRRGLGLPVFSTSWRADPAQHVGRASANSDDRNSPASNNLGAEFVTKTPADGYTMLMSNTALAVAPYLYARLGYDPNGRPAAGDPGQLGAADAGAASRAADRLGAGADRLRQGPARQAELRLGGVGSTPTSRPSCSSR